MQKQPQLGANIILHLTFSEAIKEHKSLGTWQGEGLIAIEEHSLFGGVAKRLDQIQHIKNTCWLKVRHKWMNYRLQLSDANVKFVPRQTDIPPLTP